MVKPAPLLSTHFAVMIQNKCVACERIAQSNFSAGRKFVRYRVIKAATMILLICAVLKKANAYSEDLANYRPVSNGLLIQTQVCCKIN